ncbi:MAG TPA: hypothetical protein VNK44_04665 [Candidatus Nitrosotenuis sp.]|nr:hypothetical protein [Candidatus Nitrosotenuis sp.]
MASNVQVHTQEEITKTIADSKISKSIEETTQQAQKSITESMNTAEKESLAVLETRNTSLNVIV